MPSEASALRLWDALTLFQSELAKRSEDALKTDQLEQSPFHGRSVVLGQAWTASPCEEATRLLRHLGRRFLRPLHRQNPIRHCRRRSPLLPGPALALRWALSTFR